jgi:hypothetical protein
LLQVNPLCAHAAQRDFVAPPRCVRRKWIA